MGVELAGCAKCSKYLLIVFNVIFFLVGIALLAVGIFVVVQPYQLDILAILDNPLIQNGAYLIIALGCFIVIVAGLGCFGACCASKCLLVLYFIIILIIFAAQLVGCALVIAYKPKVDSFLTDTLQTTMNDYVGENATDTYSTGWNALQILLECCGTNNYSDWSATTWAATASRPYPLTCCVFEDPNTLLTGTEWPMPLDAALCVSTTDATYLNMDGCYSSFENLVVSQIYYVGGVGLGLLIFELLAMIFAIALCRGISAGEDVV